MRKAVIVNGVVENVILHAGEPTDPNVQYVAVDGLHVDIGDLWDGASFSKAPAIPDEIPHSVTARQARLVLLGAGMLSAVEQTLTMMPGMQGEAARIEWEYATAIERDSQLINALAPALGLTSQQIDDLFRAAQAL